MMDRVTIEVVEHVAHVRLNRPEKLNALDRAMFEGLIAIGKRIMSDSAVHVVVLSGEGRGFCAGLDVASLMPVLKESPELLAPSSDSPANWVQRAIWIWQEVPQPVIAAVHGVAFGGGFQLALAADIRIVHPSARFAFKEIEWGLIPDLAATQTTRGVVALDVLKELSFTGREVGGEEAILLRLATHLDEEPLVRAMTLAREIAARSPEAIRAAKRLWNEAPFEGVAVGLANEAATQGAVIQGAGFQPRSTSRSIK